MCGYRRISRATWITYYNNFLSYCDACSLESYPRNFLLSWNHTFSKITCFPVIDSLHLKEFQKSWSHFFTFCNLPLVIFLWGRIYLFSLVICDLFVSILLFFNRCWKILSQACHPVSISGSFGIHTQDMLKVFMSVGLPR